MAVSQSRIGQPRRTHSPHQFVMPTWRVSYSCSSGGRGIVFPLLHCSVLLCAVKTRQGHGLDIVCRATDDMHVTTQDLVSAVHRHVGLPDNLLSVEFRSYGAGGGKSSFFDRVSGQNTRGVRLAGGPRGTWRA
jgi:hypothetical protein